MGQTHRQVDAGEARDGGAARKMPTGHGRGRSWSGWRTLASARRVVVEAGPMVAGADDGELQGGGRGSVVLGFGVWGHGRREGGESTGEKARDIFHPGRSRFSSLLSLPETHLHHEEAKNQLIPGPPQLTRPTRHLPIVPVMYVQNNRRFTRRQQPKKTVAARSGGPRRRARAMPLEWRVL